MNNYNNTIGVIEIDKTHVRVYRSQEVSCDLNPSEAIASEKRADVDGGGLLGLQVTRLAREHLSLFAHLRWWGDTLIEVRG